MGTTNAMTSLRNYRIVFSISKNINTNHWIYKQRIQKYSDAPVKYSMSKAAGWKAEYTRHGIPEDDSPWFQPYIVSGSVAIFLFYFCILREENDIDEILETSLYDRIEGLEQSQLRTTLKYYDEKGMDVAKIEQRLKELDGEETDLNRK